MNHMIMRMRGQGGLPELTAAGRPEQMLDPALRLCTNVGLP
jgi:hypothetical protein